MARAENPYAAVAFATFFERVAKPPLVGLKTMHLMKRIALLYKGRAGERKAITMSPLERLGHD